MPTNQSSGDAASETEQAARSRQVSIDIDITSKAVKDAISEAAQNMSSKTAEQAREVLMLGMRTPAGVGGRVSDEAQAAMSAKIDAIVKRLVVSENIVKVRPLDADEAQAAMSAGFDVLIKRFVVRGQENVVVEEVRPLDADEAQAATSAGFDVLMSADIDAIVKRLDEGIPRLNARLDELLERQRRPLTV
jgi:hypothetical protein